MTISIAPSRSCPAPPVGDVTVDRDFTIINDPRFYPGTRITSFHDTCEGDQITLYATDRIRVSDRFTAEIGAFYREFWEDYLRLDLRASWTSRVGRRGEISFFIDVQNLTDRESQRGIAIAEPDCTYDQAAGYSVSFPRENWLPMIPSFGVSYEF